MPPTIFHKKNWPQSVIYETKYSLLNHCIHFFLTFPAPIPPALITIRI